MEMTISKEADKLGYVSEREGRSRSVFAGYKRVLVD